jgi:hypothetical protein
MGVELSFPMDLAAVERRGYWNGMFGVFPPRLTPGLLIALILLLTRTVGFSELYVQRESLSPDGTVVFAIKYPPNGERPTASEGGVWDGPVQGCFLHPKSKKRIGTFFFLPGTDTEAHRPGSAVFDQYNMFDYVWSADSSHVAIVHNMRHFGVIHPFRRTGSSFQRLAMPDLAGPLKSRLKGVIAESNHTSIIANHWRPKGSLVATICRDAKLTDAGNGGKDWRGHSMQFTISFDSDGKPIVEATKFRISSD